MINYDMQQARYAVSGLAAFTFQEAARCWKTKYRTIEEFCREVITHTGLTALGAWMASHWQDFEPLTVEEAFLEPNMEKRRVLFDCIGPARLFSTLSPTLLDRQVIKKIRTRWDARNEPHVHEFEDIYELYEIMGEKLFTNFYLPDNASPFPTLVYAVRCWCTTTQREYWIYVPRYAAMGSDYTYDPPKPDAIRAIAWTFQLTISHPKRILRQGDIIVVEESDRSEEVGLYYLSKEQYLDLMYSET